MSFPIYDIIRIRMSSPGSHGQRLVYTFTSYAIVNLYYIGGGNPSAVITIGSSNTSIATCGRSSSRAVTVLARPGDRLLRSEGSGGGTGTIDAEILLLGQEVKGQTISNNGANVTSIV